jgi:GR25 family glycosyltransferase involved in LPS biosynthesis
MNDNELAIIFEDDNMFSDRFEKEISNINNLPQNEPVICYIGGRFKENFIPPDLNIYTKLENNIYMRPQNKYLVTQKNNWIFNSNEMLLQNNSIINMMEHWERCCSCIIMNKMAAKLLVKYVTEIPDIAVDNFLFKVNSFTNLINFYDYFPHLCYSPLNYKSDIQL